MNYRQAQMRTVAFEGTMGWAGRHARMQDRRLSRRRIMMTDYRAILYAVRHCSSSGPRDDTRTRRCLQARMDGWMD